MRLPVSLAGLLATSLLAGSLLAPAAMAQGSRPPNLALPPPTPASAPASEAADAPEAARPPEARPAPAVPEIRAKAAARDKPRLSSPARAAVNEAQAFANNPGALPAIGKGGRVLFTYGDSVPTVVCAPLRVCDVELEPGESIQGAPHIGDAVRWKVSPAVSMDGEQRVMHLVIKATAPDLDTNMIVPTDRRTYYLRLVSSEDKYVSRVAFEYPDTEEKAWRRLAQKPRSSAAPGAAANAAAADDLPTVPLGSLRFNYTVKVAAGSPKFKPLRVMDDGQRVYITMSDSLALDEAPVLLLVGADGSEQLINYRLRGNLYMIDRLADKLALVSGTGGEQQRVEISRDSCTRRGWFNRCIADGGATE